MAYTISVLAVAADAGAHPFDVSRSEWSVDGNIVHGHIEVAIRDLQGRTLREFVETKTQVYLGESCNAPIVEREWIEGEDGSALDARYTCRGEGDLSVKLAWLADMPPEHRHVAHLAYGKSALTAMLTKENDATSVARPKQSPTPLAAPPTRWPLIAAVFAVLAFVVMRIRMKARKS
jgi:hypothetical protein